MTASGVPSLWRRGRLFTLADKQGWGEIDHGSLLVRDGRIAWVGPDAALPAEFAAQALEEHDLQGLCVTPGLVDCHAHPTRPSDSRPPDEQLSVPDEMLAPPAVSPLTRHLRPFFGQRLFRASPGSAACCCRNTSSST